MRTRALAAVCRRMLAQAGLVVLLVSTTVARAQVSDSFGDAAAARTTAAQAGWSSPMGGADASSLLGLVEPAGGRKAVTLDELLASLGEAPDARIARERLAQGEAARKRAWALLLPTLSLSGVYTHTCTGGLGGIDCADRTANVGDPKSIGQQALLFRSLADIFGVAADAATNPDDAARYRAQQQELAGAADDIADRAGAPPIVVQPASQLAGQMTLAVPLLNPRAYPALMNAGDGVHLAALGVQQARQALALVVVRGYYAAWTAQRLVDLSVRQVALADEQRAAVSARVAAATLPPLSQKRAELELLRAKQTLAVARAAADNAVAVLGAAVGRTEMFSLAPPPPAPSEPQGDDNDLVERALQERLEVRVQRLSVAIAERGTMDAWMQFVPTVGVAATARATSFTSGFVRDPVTGVVSLNASVPLYDGGARYAALDDANSRTSEERVRLQQLQERVAAQVRGSRRDVAVRTEAVLLARQAVAVATEAHAQAQALFDAGVGTALDLSDTAVAVFAAESEAVRAEGELAVARLALRWVLGESLPSSFVAPATH
jgi:outer membrane protein TolC